MLANNLTITAPNSAGTDATFDFVLIDNNGDRFRTWVDAPVGQPTKLYIKHSSSGKGDAAIGRHLLSLTRLKKDGLLSGTGTWNITGSFPENGLFTDGDKISMLRQLANLMGIEVGTADTSAATLAFVPAFFRGES